MRAIFLVLFVSLNAVINSGNCQILQQKIRGRMNYDAADANRLMMTRASRSGRFARNPHRIIDPIEDCLLVTADEGQLFYKASATEEPKTCAVFMIAPPDMKVEITFNYLDVPCEDGGLVGWVDGWGMSDEVFPSERDAGPLATREVELCGARRPKRALLAAQNAAMMHYRVPARGKGFAFTVTHVHNPKPCNVLLYGVSGAHTLRNYGGAGSCSALAVAPSRVRVLALAVGGAGRSRSLQLETGTTHKCQKRGLSDYVEVGGSKGLDNANMEVVDSVCGVDSNEAKSDVGVACENTSVRLVSSGLFENSVTVNFEPLEMEDLATADLFCE